MGDILSMLGNIWPLILGGIMGFLYLINRWQKAKIEGKDRTIEELQHAKKVYETKEEIHKHDDQIRDNAEEQIDKVEKEVQEKETEEGQGRVIGGALNDYFNGGKDEKNN
jgi:hypothetical protein